MIYIDRERVEDRNIAEGINSFQAIARVDKPWWMPKQWIETFPKGWAPLAFIHEKEYADDIEDDNLQLMPKSGSWVKHPESGYYILARIETYEMVSKKYMALRPKGWIFTGWDLNKLFFG